MKRRGGVLVFICLLDSLIVVAALLNVLSVHY